MPIIKHIPIYAAPKRMLAYVTNEEKTEDTLVTGLNCSTKYSDAYEDMKFNFEMYSGERFFKRSIKSDTAKRERQKIRLHHYIQSFKPGEVTPEEAHQIGVEWAEKVFGKKHMVLCATHTMTSPMNFPKMLTRTILTSTMRRWRDMKPMRALSMRLTSGSRR